MKIITTAMVALLATASVALATDLPNKKATPAAPAAAVADTAAASSDSISASYGQEFDPAGYSSKQHDLSLIHI